MKNDVNGGGQFRADESRQGRVKRPAVSEGWDQSGRDESATARVVARRHRGAQHRAAVRVESHATAAASAADIFMIGAAIVVTR